MTLDNYLAEGPSPVAENSHEAIINGTEVTCNFLWCAYQERFDNVEDAETAARIHEGQEVN